MVDASLEIAVSFMLMELAGKGSKIVRRYPSYGYDLVPTSSALHWATGVDPQNAEHLGREVSPIFLEAGWELCRRGILRPGVKAAGAQSIDEGGYSLTTYGKEWLDTADQSNFVIIESGSLARVFAEYREQFGEGFHQRSQEAIRCRRAEAWLACCVMVGAASESILLAIAVAKSGDEAAILAKYNGRSGRSEVIKSIAGSLPARLANSLQGFMGLLAYWRDEAGHGQVTELSLANADEALRQLLHLCQWANKNWKALTV